MQRIKMIHGSKLVGFGRSTLLNSPIREWRLGAPESSTHLASPKLTMKIHQRLERRMRYFPLKSWSTSRSRNVSGARFSLFIPEAISYARRLHPTSHYLFPLLPVSPPLVKPDLLSDFYPTHRRTSSSGTPFGYSHSVVLNEHGILFHELAF